MAPEQLSGEGVDGRSDLFSLGVILYAMVTGHSPFHGDSATTVCFKVANREPLAASALDLNLPRELDEVIGRAMAKDREQRYQRGAEFAEDVRQLQQMFKPASTTTSLRTAARTGTRSTGTRTAKTGSTASSASQAAAMAHAVKAAKVGIGGLPIRDLILGVITIIILVVAGIESRLFVASPKASVNTSEAAPLSPGGPASDSARASAATPPAQPSAPAPSAPPHKSHSAVSHPAKQIVVPLSTLDLAVQHQFKDATLFVWVDDKLMLTRPLHGATQKHLVVFNGLRGVESDTLKVPAGKHVVRVRALSADETIDLSKSVSSEFIGGGDKSLQVTIDKHNTVMRLTWGQ
jgi:serine/threonine protein kinase